MNFTNSPYEKMMKEIPRPGRGGADRCAGCRHLKECGNRKGHCREKFRPSGQVGAVDKVSQQPSRYVIMRKTT